MTLDLTHLETLLAAATPGPWEVHQKTYGKRGSYLIIADSKQNELATDEPWEHSMFEPKDTELLVALRNAAPALIARVRELEAENDVLNEELSFLQAEEGDEA